MTSRRLPFVALLLLASLSGSVRAAVERIEIAQRQPYAEGRSFPGIGPYEHLKGTVHFAVDPLAPANRRIVDVELAPRNARGLVEFSADIEILAPVDRSRCNGTLLYGVNNRGRKLATGLFNDGADEFLMRHGYVVVWSGWLADVRPGPDAVRLRAPIATDGDATITGSVRAEICLDESATRASVGGRPYIGAYAPHERELANASLTWRLREKDPRVPIPREQWSLHVRATEPGHLPFVEIELPAGFAPGYLYEFIYVARDPVVQGLGLAGIRDLISFLRHDTSEINPLRIASGDSAIERTIGFGISQSGRCLRVMLHEGFNADERGRRVFDGMIPHVAGGGLGFFNHRFALPSQYNSQHVAHLFPCDRFPFAYGPATDPFTGTTDHLLRTAREQGVVPKIVHTQTSAEYWHRSGSLVHTDPKSKRDAEIPPEVRIHAIGGAQHGSGNDVPGDLTLGQLPENPTDYRPFLRALLVGLDDWIRDDREPPASVYPRIADGTLVGWRANDGDWPMLPGVRYPEVIQQPELLDFGPKFETERVLTRHPPTSRGPYPVLVPAHDADGNERGVLKLPSIAVPVATYTGWNLRHRRTGAEHELFSLKGSYVPFPRTKHDRERTGDPRPSLGERYRDADDYLQRTERAIDALVASRHLLEEDRRLLLERARRRAESIPRTPPR